MHNIKTMKSEEQIRSKLSSLKRRLKYWEKENDNNPQGKWLKYICDYKARVEILQWILDDKT